jgi:excinuclease UvrABC nuclease subunit
MLDCRADFDPDGDFEAFLRQAPAKWAIYLMADADDRPVQLLSVKNLRYSLKRRLGVDPEAPPSRRVDYRQLVRHVYWRPVSSRFESDWLYYEAAREVFPATYQGMVGFRPAWFVHVNPNANFPRYVKTIDLGRESGLYIGPLEDKHAAARLMELAEDAFDLCRYYPILVQAPHANACAYKEMGKCPAPCDGSISMPQYRRMMQWSAQMLVDPQPMVRDQNARMRAAAQELRFELAGKIKAFAASLEQLGKGVFLHVRLLEDFTFLSLQHGVDDEAANVFLITPGQIEQIATLTAEPSHPSDLLQTALGIAAQRRMGRVDSVGAERIGVVVQHLFAAKGIRGIFLPLASIDEKSLVKGYRDLLKQRQPQQPDEQESEGVLKELQSLEGPLPPEQEDGVHA